MIQLLANDLQRPTKRSSPLPVALQVMLALRFFASGTFQMVLGGTLGVSQSSVCRVVRDVATALCGRAGMFIKFPTTAAQCITIKQQFSDIAGFPNVLGAVDGTHVAIKAPQENEDLYVNRKHFHSINVQVICDANLKVIDLVAKWPGSTHDSFMFTNSGTGIKFNEGEMPDGWLLGDSGYPLRPWLMTPVLHPASEAEERYTRAQQEEEDGLNRQTGLQVRQELIRQWFT
ncbi:putative nuclease HARBI1 [Engraulis encrasicolus]|uniref:putative nuclease HARBI1 n=1 Tax=Engraulis encrasicolus TaxID=184585 RepID=UPI002FCF9F10